MLAGVTAGYGDEIIFADGSFIDGSTAELSADGPMRTPYTVYCQVRWAVCSRSASSMCQTASSCVRPSDFVNWPFRLPTPVAGAWAAVTIISRRQKPDGAGRKSVRKPVSQSAKSLVRF